jgi:hypothetical protein
MWRSSIGSRRMCLPSSTVPSFCLPDRSGGRVPLALRTPFRSLPRVT